MTDRDGAAVLPRPALILVTDSGHLRGRSTEDVVREAVLGGVDVVQLREKDRDHAGLVGFGARVRDAIAGRALFVVNSDVDVAFVLRADGVHLPEDSTASVSAVRAGLTDDALISRAVHSIDAAAQAERDGVDVVQIGTVFASQSHPGGATIGVEGVRAVCDAVHVRVIAIGGITAANAGDVVRAGAAGVAVIGAILDADDPRRAAAELRRAIDGVFASRT